MIYKKWLITADAMAELDACHTPEARQAAAGHELRSRGPSLQVANNIATIDVRGPLMPERSALYEYFDIEHTAYSDIVTQLNDANADDSVKSITMRYDTPGGTVAGMFETADAIRSSSKPVTAIVEGMAASAGYGLASQADEIHATGRMSVLGSVGVVTSRYVSNYVVDITSSNAPNKRPDVRTEEGKAAIRAELDEIEAIFLETIAAGRDTTTDNVAENYGRGGTMLADNALKRGMIDKILTAAPAGQSKATKVAQAAETKKGVPMDLKELKAQHPELFAQAVAVGVEQERDRVNGHLNSAGGNEAAQKIALDAIASGADLSASIIGQYVNARVNTADIAAAESDAVADVDTNAAAADTINQDTSKIAAQERTEAAVLEQLGVSIDG